MYIYQLALFIVVLMALTWILFRYIIRLVKAAETMADSLDDISQSLKNIQESLGRKEEKEDSNGQ